MQTGSTLDGLNLEEQEIDNDQEVLATATLLVIVIDHRRDGIEFATQHHVGQMVEESTAIGDECGQTQNGHRCYQIGFIQAEIQSEKSRRGGGTPLLD
jgi:hypothetical protein